MLHNTRVLAVGDHFFIISKMNKTSSFKPGHFINIYIINRTLHGRLGIRILSSRAESSVIDTFLTEQILEKLSPNYTTSFKYLVADRTGIELTPH